jgi:osmotically-inducible protein OsmY
MTAVWLGVAMIPLAGCDRDISAVHAEKDAQGKTRVHVDGEKVDQNFDQAKKDFEAAGEQAKEGAQQVGEQVKEGAQQVGKALQRGAEKVAAEVQPAAEEVLNDAGITARIKAKLLADPEVPGSYIDVDTLEGRVTLNGKVNTEEEKAEAEKLARHTEGVKEIVNLIQVAGKPAPVPKPHR